MTIDRTTTDRSTAAHDYLEVVRTHVSRIAAEQTVEIEQVAQRLAASIASGGVLHVFGTGHSQLVALEMAERAAGLGAVHAIADPALSPIQGRRAAATERLSGYGDIVVATEDLRAGEVIAIVSNSGLNAVPIDVAIAASRLGLFVVAVTSRPYSEAASSRHPSGKRLFDVADVTLDTGSPAGDGALHLDDGTVTGPLSSILSMTVLHAVGSRTAQLLADEGRASVLVSQNLDVDPDVNAELFTRYADRRRA